MEHPFVGTTGHRPSSELAIVGLEVLRVGDGVFTDLIGFRVDGFGAKVWYRKVSQNSNAIEQILFVGKLKTVHSLLCFFTCRFSSNLLAQAFKDLLS